MVRMPPLPVRKEDNAGASLADHSRNLQPVFPRVLDAAIGNIERLPPAHAQDFCRVFGFARAAFCAAASSHFALREIENAGAMALPGRFEQCAAAGLFYVVAVGGYGKNVKRSRRHVSQDSPAPSRRSPARSGDAPPFLLV